MVTSARSAFLALSALGLLSITGCGAGPRRTALAVASTRWDGSTLVVRTECSDAVQAEGAPDPADPTLYVLTMFGRPTLGRCRPEVRLSVPPETTRLLDETTSQVVDLPPR